MIPKIYRILIVDDSKNIRQVIRRYLELGVYDQVVLHFYEANDGDEAEDLLQNQLINHEPIDLVFLDWMMPKVTGYDFLKKIRGTQVFKENPKIVMLTAETNTEQFEACLKFGVSRYVLKPFTQEMLIEVLQQVIRGEDAMEKRYGI
jgi:CheY-like chemotaxis protein